MIVDKQEYAPSEVANRYPREDVPPPAYSQVNHHVDRETGFGAYATESRDGPWPQDAPAPYEASQPYPGQMPSEPRQSYSGHSPTPGVASQPYTGYGDPTGVANHSQNPYTSPSPYASPSPHASQSNIPHHAPYSEYASPSGGMNPTPAGYASTAGLSGRGSTYASDDRSPYGSSSSGRGFLSAGRTSGMGRGYSYEGAQTPPGPMFTRGGGGVIGVLMNSSSSPAQKIGSLLDPPPPSFLRSVRPDLPYEPFEPASLASLNEDLASGFPQLPPPSRAAPHPFATHDIAEEDWRRFLHDVKAATALSSATAGVAPGDRNGGLVRLIVSKGIEYATKDRKHGAVGALIGQWNANFFHPRRVTVVLARGAVAYSGSDGAGPPDMMAWTADDDSSSSDDDFGGREAGDYTSERRAAKEQRRLERRARKQDRRAEHKARKEQKKNKHERWRLVIAYKPVHGY
ncbi:hypothetical protein DAEQUDRAFT_739896 [Daedalea quercina L-15889]|uniref:Uncharacterized protein n=1 Tax=Daedalea quercina L-15889 TaxID=1314783 RepID=A0A165N8L7_9APHY|nr:hypothetical protein DAEQUDRAFT_739896 [Daedalea quercina L-15889]